MWTSENRGRYDRSRLRYPSDLTDDEWAPAARDRLRWRHSRGVAAATRFVDELIDGKHGVVAPVGPLSPSASPAAARFCANAPSPKSAPIAKLDPIVVRTTAGRGPQARRACYRRSRFSSNDDGGK
jgi:hypothetical protein